MIDTKLHFGGPLGPVMCRPDAPTFRPTTRAGLIAPAGCDSSARPQLWSNDGQEDADSAARLQRMAGGAIMAPLSRVRIFLLLLVTVAPHVGALTQVQGAAAQPAPAAESYVAEGDRFARSREYDKAVEAYRQALRINPALAPAHHGLGATYLNMGRPADAIEPLKAAARLDPQNAIVHMTLGIALAAMRRADEAIVEMNEARGLAPQNPRVHNELGNLLHNGFGRIDEALTSYEEARRLDPNIAAVHHNIGLMLMRLGRFSQAIDPLTEALRLDPAYRNARYLLSDAYMRSGRYLEAIDSWTKFLELVPGGPEALHNRAWTYLYLGAHGQAVASDARTLLQSAGWRTAVAPFLVLLAHLGNRQAGLEADARAVLDDAARNCDTKAWPYPVIAYMRGELSPEALLAAASNNDRKTEAHAYMGMDLLLRGRVADAREHFVWVKEYGNKRFLEYPLAVAELARLGL
jgi:tetratricopeptide (TPR) repeat protein